jgi:hypothetical protein
MPSATEIDDLRRQLVADGPPLTDAQRIELIAALERLKSGAAASQARLSVDFDASQRSEQARQGVRAAKQGAGVASQVALARRDSPVKGGHHLGLAKALVNEMPHTFRALADGDLSEWRATIIVRETATLSAEHRRAVDQALAGRLAGLGDAGVTRMAKKLAYELDPANIFRRIRGAVKDRRVSIRPAPDTMTYLTGFLPVAQGVAVHASLSRHADSLRAAGDGRTRGQIMADTLVERVTGQASAPAVPVEVELVMTDATLLGEDNTPAHLVGYGPIPASEARSLVRGGQSLAERAKAWVRRLYASPATGELVAMESRRREFDGQLRHFLVLRDEFCRTPWCDAPIRHADHVRPVVAGGETAAENGQGLCETCNYVKESLGWQSVAGRDPAGRQTVTVTTPTGHSYTASAPDPPGWPPKSSTPFSQHTARSQSPPSPSRSSDSSWCA